MGILQHACDRLRFPCILVPTWRRAMPTHMVFLSYAPSFRLSSTSNNCSIACSMQRMHGRDPIRLTSYTMPPLQHGFAWILTWISANWKYSTRHEKELLLLLLLLYVHVSVFWPRLRHQHPRHPRDCCCDIQRPFVGAHVIWTCLIRNYCRSAFISCMIPQSHTILTVLSNADMHCWSAYHDITTPWSYSRYVYEYTMWKLLGQPTVLTVMYLGGSYSIFPLASLSRFGSFTCSVGNIVPIHVESFVVTLWHYQNKLRWTWMPMVSLFTLHIQRRSLLKPAGMYWTDAPETEENQPLMQRFIIFIAHTETW